jgi:UDP-MurNAc hydroxylase
MRITSLGHASIFIETSGGTILCDPWFTPAYFGSWFPFPRNDRLDVTPFAHPDYLYISHTHRDHLDLQWLAAHVDRSTQVLLPDFGIDQLETELRSIGLERFVRTRNAVPIELDGLRVAIQALAEPSVGPMGDSLLVVQDDTATTLNQNDAHPHDFEILAEFPRVDLHCLQYSGAIWWPMAYEMPAADMQRLVELKRQRQFQRVLTFIAMIDAPHIMPMAGPPCFLDADLFAFNELPGGPATIFPDATAFLAELASATGERRHGHLSVPGSTITVRDGDCTVAHALSAAEVDAIFSAKEEYLRRYQADWAEWLAAERAGWGAGVSMDIAAELKAWWEPLLASAPRVRDAVGLSLLLEATSPPGAAEPGDQVLVDFPAGVVKVWEGEPYQYTYRAERPLLVSSIARRVEDWCNELFLSCRFRAARDGNFNEALMTFFKSLSAERMAYAESFYSRTDPDIDWISLDGHVIERRCPHQRADLSRMGTICDGVLECAVHGWRWDIDTGKCLNAEGSYLRVKR